MGQRCVSLLDRLECWAYEASWVPDRIAGWTESLAIRVGWWCRDKTLTAVGDDEWGTPGIRVPSRWDADGVPTAWIIMHQVHTETEACQDGCVIHHPLDHHMRHWRLIWRSDRGIFERLCEHGVGHPDPSQGPYWTRMGQDWQWVHGCCMDDDGKPCCARAARQIPLAEGRR